MSISAHDVRRLSSSPGPGGVPLTATEVDRVAAVLNRSSAPRSASDTISTPAAGVTPVRARHRQPVAPPLQTQRLPAASQSRSGQQP